MHEDLTTVDSGFHRYDYTLAHFRYIRGLTLSQRDESRVTNTGYRERGLEHARTLFRGSSPTCLHAHRATTESLDVLRQLKIM